MDAITLAGIYYDNFLLIITVFLSIMLRGFLSILLVAKLLPEAPINGNNDMLIENAILFNPV